MTTGKIIMYLAIALGKVINLYISTNEAFVSIRGRPDWNRTYILINQRST